MPGPRLDVETVETARFYDQHYTMKSFFLRPGRKKILGNKANRVCRFCSRGKPEVSFRKKAHAIPEFLGNKSIFTNYECDSCNHFFGCGIETDLANWSKPNRTFAHIKGKNGIPTLKKGGAEPGWRIEYSPTDFQMTEYEDDPFFVIDEERKQIRFELKRDAYTPVAVLKAFVKIGLTLLPDEELPNFSEALAWIRDPDHTKNPAEEIPIAHTFQPGPMPNDLIVVILMRRKDLVMNVPYTFLVLSYGNDVFQVCLPSPKRDNAIIGGQKLVCPAFPVPKHPDPTRYGKARVEVLDLCSRELIQGERLSIVLGFDQVAVKD